MPKLCVPCRAKRGLKKAAQQGTLRGAFADCADCEEGMEELREKLPGVARVVQPAHDYLTGKDAPR